MTTAHRHPSSTSTSTSFPSSTNQQQGRDKHENENLIAHALPHDIWFHVEDMSSAHVYLRPPASLCPAVVASAKPGKGSGGGGGGSGSGAGGNDASFPSPSGRQGGGDAASPAAPPLPPRAWHDIPPKVLADCCQLVKHNSISGSKASTVDVVFTPWSNLKKTDRMDVGQVRFLFFCSIS